MIALLLVGIQLQSESKYQHESFILSFAQSPRAPCQFLDTYVALDEASPVDASETQKGSARFLFGSRHYQ